LGVIILSDVHLSQVGGVGHGVQPSKLISDPEIIGVFCLPSLKIEEEPLDRNCRGLVMSPHRKGVELQGSSATQGEEDKSQRCHSGSLCSIAEEVKGKESQPNVFSSGE
jgi:hypothetical protein